MIINFSKIFLPVLICLLWACKKENSLYPYKGIIIGFDKRLSVDCKGKLLIRLDQKLDGYLASGYASDSNFQIRNIPQSLKVDTNSVFPIAVVLDYTTTDIYNCKNRVIDIVKIARVSQ